MVLLRHPTGHEQDVPEDAVPYFPEWEVVDDVASDDVPRRNAGREAWAAYAESNNFTVADEVGRDEIVAALAEAGVPTE